jgi:CHAT domain-containing protein
LRYEGAPTQFCDWLSPGQIFAPFVEKEIEGLKELIPNCTVVSSPTKEAVLSTLNNHQIVHFSCHGSTSVSDPALGKVVLNDWKTDPLTVSDFSSRNFPSPQLAYFSACHTAVTRDMRLLDESIHLVFAIQLAGCPSVIGSLWQVQDELSFNLSRDVYARMLEWGGGKYIDTSKSAEALHGAVRQMKEMTTMSLGLRDDSLPILLSWPVTYTKVRRRDQVSAPISIG